MKHEPLSKTNNILFFIFAVLIILYYGASFLRPFTFGIFLATLMTPFSNLLEKIKVNRIFSSLISTLLIFLVVGSLSYLFFYQLSRFAKDLPFIRNELQNFIGTLQDQVFSMTGLSLEDQDKILKDRSEVIINTAEIYLTRILGDIFDTTIKFLLVLIYVFLLMLYRNKFYEFFMMYADKENEGKMAHVIIKIRRVGYQYLWGRVKVMSILGVMYYITFMIFDVPYAILLTIFGALITIIPYIGPLISGLLPIIFTILFGMSFYDILFFATIIVIIQLIESYVLEPFIIGKEVEVNPLTVIIAVILGGMIWGIAGMILFVPIFAMIKIISNQSSSLKPIGFLLGTSGGRNQ